MGGDGPHGWRAEPWLPFPPDPAGHSVETERADGGRCSTCTPEVVAVPAGGGLAVEVAGVGVGEGEPFGGSMGPDQAVILWG